MKSDQNVKSQQRSLDVFGFVQWPCTAELQLARYEEDEDADRGPIMQHGNSAGKAFCVIIQSSNFSVYLPGDEAGLQTFVPTVF